MTNSANPLVKKLICVETIHNLDKYLNYHLSKYRLELFEQLLKLAKESLDTDKYETFKECF